MAVALVDSNVVIGAASRRDTDHRRALDIMRGIDAGALPTARLTNYVIAESMNYIHERTRHAVAVDLYDRLKQGARFEFDHSPKVDFARADEVFHDYDTLSFVDATISAYMEREGVEYLYSFDDDFDVLDHVTRLATAENPFK